MVLLLPRIYSKGINDIRERESVEDSSTAVIIIILCWVSVLLAAASERTPWAGSWSCEQSSREFQMARSAGEASRRWRQTTT